MNKKENKKKIDVEAKMFMTLLHLKEEKNKNYSIEECKKNIVYLFENYDEFKFYFELNCFTDIDKDLLEMCRMKTTKKGTIIALKGLCDYAIRKHNLIYSHTIDLSSEEKQNKFQTFSCGNAKVTFDENGYIVKVKDFSTVMWCTPNQDEKLIGKHIIELAKMLKKSAAHENYISFLENVIFKFYETQIKDNTHQLETKEEKGKTHIRTK